MSAEVFPITQRPASTFSTVKGLASGATLNTDEQDALSTCSTVVEALDILSAAVARSRVVTSNSIGHASSVDNS